MTPSPHYTDEQITLHHGDSLDVLRDLPDASVDAIVTDPPYGLEFMGKEWDAPWKTGNGFRRAANEADAGRDNAFGRTSRRSPEYIAGRGYQDWCQAWATECLRVLKPGGHLLAFGAPRTYHRLAAGIEDAGFEIRDSIHWVYGSGFPKGQDIAKAIDRRRFASGDFAAFKQALAQAVAACGKTRQQINAECGFTMRFDIAYEKDPVGWGCSLPSPQQYDVIVRVLGGGLREWPRERFEVVYRVVGYEDRFNAPSGIVSAGRASVPVRREITASASAQARTWEGWNTALKPAHEPIIVARKSTGFNTTVANVLEHGTGALNIDGCRVLTGQSPSIERRHGKPPEREAGSWANDRRSAEAYAAEHPGESLGRWPANLVLTHSPDCEQVGERVIPGDPRAGQEPGTRPGGFGNIGADSGGERPNGTLHGEQVVPVFACAPGCPVAELDRQSGVLTSGANPSRRGSDKFRDAYGDFAGQRECTPARGADSGGASRFFPIFKYEAKAPASERPRLPDGTAHATVKPLDLMRWLVRLVTPPGGTVLDPFAGSGTTGEAAILEGFNALLVEREQAYADLIVARLSKPLQPSLFGLGDAA